ncbi:Fatty acid transporter protein [Cytospora mali]|uniref:Fatty acid transporter protein n=1 Tax=Cytospora mali TaxID=578113 RepID=A0A194UNZ6_CYTMA|nr:Fatty acid transporter protein [Valsa mali var. pyri (nom. inval.)]
MGSTSSEAENARLLVRAIDNKAKLIPNHTFLRFPGEDWEVNGYSTITWRQYVDGINKVAHWLDDQLGKSVNNETVAYMGPNDVRYTFVWPALNKTNRKFLVPDGRITKAGLSNLLKATDCKVWMYAQEDISSIEELGISESCLKRQPFPSLDWCLSADGTPDYPYEKTWEEAKFDEIIIIHTSGTTGMPKPIFTNNGYWACQTAADIMSRMAWPQGTILDTQFGRTMLTTCPPKWGAGVATMVTAPAFWDCVAVIPPPDEFSVSPGLFTKIMRLNKIQGLWAPPQTIVGLYKDPTTKSLLENLDSIVFVGASLDKAIGDELSKHTKLLSYISSTETGARFILAPRDRKLWDTFEYAPQAPHRFIKREGTGDAADGSDDLYELVFDRPADGKPTLFCSAWWNPMYKDVDVVETRELYSPVQDLGGGTRWEFKSRTDDLLKLNWLAKFNAKHIESMVLRHADVNHVLVGGEGRPVPFVIVEPKSNAREGKSADALLNEIYDEAVVQANKADVGEIRIPRETVLLTKPEKPFKVSLKQLVVRREVEKDYSEEIEEAYARLKNATGNGVVEG